MSATLAKDSRARPKALGSSSTDISASDRTAHAVRHGCLQTDGDHVADHDRPGSAAVDRDGVAGELVERAAPDLLSGLRRVDDHRGRRGARPAAIEQVTG